MNNLLIVIAQDGWGDSVYVLGLIHKLRHAGIRSSVATLQRCTDFYRRSFVVDVFALENEDDARRAAEANFDMAIDLTYAGVLFWKERRAFLQRQVCWCVTIGSWLASSKHFHEFVDVSCPTHMAERMGLLFSFLSNSGDSSAIEPFYDSCEAVEEVSVSEEVRSFASKFENGRSWVYLNTAGRFQERCFSRVQIERMIDCCKMEGFGVVVYSKDLVPECGDVLNLPRMQIGELVWLLNRPSIKAVISPDTALVHVGSALGLPVLAFFRGNDRDYFRQHSMADTWAPRSKGSVIVAEDGPWDPKCLNPLLPVGAKRIDEISLQRVEGEVEEFLRKLRDVGEH